MYSGARLLKRGGGPMGSFTKRCVTQVTFMESTSVEDDIRAITLEVQSDGVG